jgi:hypothetical protein
MKTIILLFPFFFSLPKPTMKTSLASIVSIIAIIVLIFALSACSPAIPRAIVAPPSVVSQINTTGAEKAAGATRKSVRDIVDAGEETRRATAKLKTTSDRLRDEINHAESIQVANVELQAAFIEIQKFADELSNDLSLLSASLAFAEEKERIAISTVDDLSDELSILKANAKAQSVQIDHVKTENTILRKQVEALATASDDLAIANDKAASRLKTIWKFAAFSGIVLVLLFRKPIGLLFGIAVP